MSQIVVDFFRLRVGNQWVCSYRYSYSDAPNYAADITAGTDIWEIDGDETISFGKEYHFTARFDGTRIRTWRYPSPGSNATIVTLDGDFVITEDSLNRLDLDPGPNLTDRNYLSPIFMNLRAAVRYNTPVATEIYYAFTDPNTTRLKLILPVIPVLSDTNFLTVVITIFQYPKGSYLLIDF